jgi:hypothetical protein
VSAPALIIRIELERRPVVYADYLHEGEGLRMLDWLRHHPAQAELIERALELAKRERAA